MPRTLKALKKCFLNNQIVPEGKIFTTSQFDKKELPKALVDVALVDDPVDPADDLDDDLDESEGEDGYSESELNEKTVPELKAIAKHLRVDNYSKMTKDSLVIAIMSMQEANEALQDTSTVEGTGLATPVNSVSEVNPV